MTPNVAAFLRRAHLDAQLGERVIAADTYAGLAALALEAGISVSTSELEAAFRERNAKVLAEKMIRAGMVETKSISQIPVLDKDRWADVLALDLSPVYTQLVNRKDWTPERAASTEFRYRCFLYIALYCEGLPSVPTSEVDEYWHQHILNTKRYAADCERLAGHFIHHNPSSGASVEESNELEGMFFQTWVAYETLFNIPYEETIGAALLQRWPNPEARMAA